MKRLNETGMQRAVRIDYSPKNIPLPLVGQGHDYGLMPVLQEAQLSQKERDRAMHRVIEYFAKLLKVTRGHSK